MKVIIFGAGASYDCINRFHDEEGEHPSHQWRPPLGNDIFGKKVNFREIYDLYPGAQVFSNSINASNDIEDFFQKKWSIATEHNDNITLANLINTQYCLQHLFYTISKNYSKNIGSNNYQILIQQAHDYYILTGEEVVFITFNYDLLLEQELIKFYNDSEKITLETYTKYPIKIFKPHGSCNWFLKFKEGKQFQIVDLLMEEKPNYDQLISQLDSKTFVDEYPLNISGNDKRPFFHFGMQDQSAGTQNRNFNIAFPQILIPLKTKDEFLLPTDHEELMKGYLAKMTDLLVIGWKGQEAHFIETLKQLNIQHPINVTTVTGEDESIVNELKVIANNIEFNRFDSHYIESKYQDGRSKIILHHENGYFSSYILNVTKGEMESFFEIKEEVQL